MSHRRDCRFRIQLPISLKNLGVVPEALPHVLSLEEKRRLKSHNVLGVAEDSREEQIF